MQFKSLNATFGKLENCTLAFSGGLNIVEAPNESGKSTLAAFLRTMLYGLKTNERGTLADKNRYLPWSGAPMCGSLDLMTADTAITLRRDTVRANSPMGHFSAVYIGTGTEVPDLTGTDCGETLLGIPREVYERSAFIRQSGLAIDSDAELERRIAALITTGEEGASYSETADKLKKLLNTRKHNKTGRIPLLEGEITALVSEVGELHQLNAERIDAQSTVSALQAEKEHIKHALAAHDLYDKYAVAAERQAAEREANDADTKCELLYRMIRDAETPEKETLEECRSKIRALSDLEAQQNVANEKQQQARAALDAFSAQAATGKSAATSVLFAAAIVCGVSCLIAVLLWNNVIGAACFGIGALAFLAAAIAASRKSAHQKAAAAQQRAKLESDLQEANAAVRVLDAAHEMQASAILSVIPVEDIVHARAYIDENLSRYEMLAKLQQEADRAQMHLEVLPAVNDPVSAESVERPAESRETLQSKLESVERRLADAQRAIDFTDGRIRAIGEREELEASLEEKRNALAILYNEYDAIALAMESLEHANTTLQTRFSPALGKKAAELFSALTDGKYDKILLDRAFRAQAEEADSPVVRDVQLLSQGAADQLYLAVRLAICDLVLPSDRNIPLVLDDALTNFDDKRCQKALELLLAESQNRQIILLTCQNRESAYLSNRVGVTTLSM